MTEFRWAYFSVAVAGCVATAIGIYKSLQFSNGGWIGMENLALCGMLFIVSVVIPFTFFLINAPYKPEKNCANDNTGEFSMDDDKRRRRDRKTMETLLTK